MVSNWHALRIPECRLRIDGTTGSLLSQKLAIAVDDAVLTIHRVDGEIERRAYSQERAAVINMGESIKALLVAIDENRSPHHSGRDNLHTMAIVDAAYLSASRGGSEVTIDEVWSR
jgi:predicted dehydrogenase